MKKEKGGNKNSIKYIRKSERGITLVAVVVTIIILLVISGVTISALLGDDGIIRKAQQIKDMWNNVMQNEMESMEDLKNQISEEYIEGNIPIITAEQLLKIGTGEEINVNGETYIFDKGKTYVLQNDIEYTGSYENIANLIKNEEISFIGQGNKIIVTNENGIKEYYTKESKYYIATNSYGYVLEGLQLYYDGIDNVGEGLHSNTTTVWKDLSGNNRDGTLKNFGSSAISGWNNEYLSLDGVNDWVNCGEINSENVTLETVQRLKSSTEVDRATLGNWQSGGQGIFTKGGTLKSNLYCNSQYHEIDSNISVSDLEKNIITYTLSYNGQEEILYTNGEENAKMTIVGNIGSPVTGTVMAIGCNPSADGSANSSYSDIDVYAVRIYNRGLTQEEIEINNNVDNIRFKSKDAIPVYTAEQLLKVGTGQEVAVEEENKTYTYGTKLKYELKNDISISGDYASIINKINNKEIELILNDYRINNNGNYYTANSKYTIAVNEYGYVKNGLQLLLDGKDNTGTGSHSTTATTWKDLSGNNIDGTLQNMDISNCWEEDGLKFDGVDDYVLIAEMNYDNITLETVCSGGASDSFILTNIQTGGYAIYQRSNKYRFEAYITENAGYSIVPGTAQFNNTSDSIYSISGSYDGKTMNMRTSNGNTTYQEIEVEGTIKKPNGNTYIILGANPEGMIAKDEYYDGKISSVRIYNRALTDEENSVNNLNDRERYNV